MRHVSGLLFASGLLLTASVAAQAQEVALHNINDSGVSYSTALTATNSTFVTSFKGTNDVTETLLGGSVTTSLTNTFPASPGGCVSGLCQSDSCSCRCHEVSCLMAAPLGFADGASPRLPSDSIAFPRFSCDSARPLCIRLRSRHCRC